MYPRGRDETKKVSEDKDMERDSPEWGKEERFGCPQTSKDLYSIYCSVAVPQEET